uniref:Uncharacterized protein n=1 Tax=Crocodylus porosus TaxID=8502 RepID=A0A7M4FER2_CROPO
PATTGSNPSRVIFASQPALPSEMLSSGRLAVGRSSKALSAEWM